MMEGEQSGLLDSQLITEVRIIVQSSDWEN
jgi:hypothetical protein